MSLGSSSSPGPVTISLSELLSPTATRSEVLNERVIAALGSDSGCLGIIVIKDLPPDFPALREKLFRLACRLANLPDEVKERFSSPETSYLFGWSHGKEIMNGKPDTQKGSYYANPLIDFPNVSEQLRDEHPEYYAGNVWPEGVEGLEEFEKTFKALGKIIFDVGIALATACETFVSPALSNPSGTIASLISSSKCNKARLLHYYPQPPSAQSAKEEEDIQNDALCGTHLDHSLLTGLCSAMYLSQSEPSGTSEPQIVDPPNDSTGLWIYPRNSKDAVKVTIPRDCLAFQTGEALSLLTSNKLSATPHFVSGSTKSQNPVSRETFAFFLQPDVDDVIGPEGETFGQFTKRVLGRHYAEKSMGEAED
ncbi:hypothetical protein I302_105141 [Kwoniella bestiolae CBS 10118]|uniref:Uncharacterized protein n=1 Tax=Kwoniella bestiolae CBS 10118 TaxID=1296100 RepID=A0A1B9FSB0_9TREE|nr:hypothetical protein I302_08430 [Kwoniella bestiolae CBS 10118]OCF21653.1 hypothetical protein I302_08430 [Kwoniella bestiolae CBS 10118]